MNPIELPYGVRVLFSARADGNLSSTTGVDAERAESARERLRTDSGLERLLAGKQVHGTRVHRDVLSTTAPGADGYAETASIEADGYATAARGVGTMVLVADCLPVALGARGAVGMLHAGWRGLAAGVLDEGIRALREVGGEGEIAAAIGPGAGVCCYEVGDEVHAAFANAHRQGRHLDLRAIARERLAALGVRDVQHDVRCTICEEDLFSHRREGVRSGRQAGVAWLS